MRQRRWDFGKADYF